MVNVYKWDAFIEAYVFFKWNNIVQYHEWGTGAIKKNIKIRITYKKRNPLI